MGAMEGLMVASAPPAWKEGDRVTLGLLEAGPHLAWLPTQHPDTSVVIPLPGLALALASVEL